MSEDKIELSKSSIPITDEPEQKPILDKLGRAYATGRRKTSVSRVWIKYGSPKAINTINK